MPIDPASLQPELPSPIELAQTILDHDFSPHTERFLGTNVREQLLYNAADDHHPAARLLAPLIQLADGLPLTPLGKRDLAHGLEVLAAYRQDSMRVRDRAAVHANPDVRPRNAAQAEARRAHGIFGRPTEDAQRDAHHDMTGAAIEIGNLKLIEKLLCTLAMHPEVNVRLIEPGRAAGR